MLRLTHPDVLFPFQRLDSLVSRVAALPNIKAYVAKRPDFSL